MGHAIATMGEVERRRRVALGPSERPSAVSRLLGGGRIAEPSRRRSVLHEVIVDELKAIGSFGGNEVHEIREALERGDKEEAIAKLIGAGMAAHHAFELVEKLTEVHLVSSVGTVAGHAAGSAGIGLCAVELALMQAKLGLATIAQAHADGERDAALYKYAQVWSELVVERLYDGGVVRPGMELLPHLEEARGRAVHDALVTLKWMEAHTGLAAQLVEQLGTRSNARRWLIDVLVERAGVRGVLNHEEVR